MNNCNHCNAQFFPDCECLASGNHHSDCDLSIPVVECYTYWLSELRW